MRAIQIDRQCRIDLNEPIAIQRLAKSNAEKRLRTRLIKAYACGASYFWKQIRSAKEKANDRSHAS
jgi:hypothetical protein